MPYSLVGCMSAKMAGCHHVRRDKVLSYKLCIYVLCIFKYIYIPINAYYVWCVFVLPFLRLYARFKSFFGACFQKKQIHLMLLNQKQTQTYPFSMPMFQKKTPGTRQRCRDSLPPQCWHVRIAALVVDLTKKSQ